MITPGGYCSRCRREHGFRTDPARPDALELQNSLLTHRRLDYLVPEERADPRFSLDYLYGPARGQMFGVLRYRDQRGKTGVLRAFSGQYNGTWTIPGWVPPLFPVDEFDRMTAPADREIKELGRQIERSGTSGVIRTGLIRKRREVSRKLMEDLHGIYQIHNFRGEKAPLSKIFQGTGGIPNGTGDCCAPKLLNYAAANRLTPMALAEFYLGRENRAQTRQEGRFYPPCPEKCRPILGFMLCGLTIAQND